ncbi:MAG: hypothetical protein IAI49_11415 [Candidatus Eremiobacteraeota bacterium]|nr:hypothetical protein [Candidatus Eremiobacteraeota bacterium]
MQADFDIRRASFTILRTATLAVMFAATANLAFAEGGHRSETAATPAFMFLDIPSTSGRAATELPVESYSYDAEVGAPLQRTSSRFTDDADVRGSFILVTSDATAPLRPKAQFVSLTIVEADENRNVTRRLTFHDVKIAGVGPAGDEPAERITFTARTVTIH